MPEKFMGAEVRRGQFTSKTTGQLINYNNLVMVFGHETQIGIGVDQNHPIVKVKNTREDIMRVFGEPISMKWLEERLGWYADIFYDVNQRVTMIKFYGLENPFAAIGDGEEGLDDAISVEGIEDYPADSLVASEDNDPLAPAEESSSKKGGKK